MTHAGIAPDPPDAGDIKLFWHIIAITAFGATAGLIFLTASYDTCTPVGHALVFAGWLVTPVLALASLAAAATATRHSIERYVAWSVTGVLSVAWLGALGAASIGPVVHQVGC